MAEQQIPVLAEHQDPQANTTNPTGYTPSEDEKRALALGRRLFEKAKKARAKYDEKWLDYYKFFRGKQWREQRPSYRHAEVINFVFQAIQSMVPIETDARPRFEFLPQEPSDMEIAKILSEVAASDWERGNWLLTLAECFYDKHIYGAEFGHMGFDPDANYGMGAILFESGDPFYCFPDPNARDVNCRRSRYFCYAEPTDIEVLRREYPAKAQYLKADLIDLMQGEKTDLDQVKFKSPVDNRTITEGTSAYEAGAQDKALKVTIWMKSDEFVEEEKTLKDAAGIEQKRYEQRLKYPNGRKICFAGGVLLDDDAIEYDDGLFPYAKGVNYILPREFWGISEVEQLESPQKIFNKLVSFALDVLTLMGNPIWVVDTTADVDTDNLFNRPGLVVEKAPGGEVRREEGVQLQPYVLQLIDRMQTWFQDISGRTDVTQGVNPTGVTAASAIQSLQEAAQTRMRQKSRNNDAFLQNLGQLYKNRVFQFYSAPRIIRLTSNPGAQKYFKFYIERVESPDGGAQYKATVRDFNEMGQESLEAREFMIKSDFDVRVSTGSALPFAKEAKSNLAFKLHDAGAIDEPELLEAVDYPNREAVWARVEQRRAMAAQAEMGAQAAAPAMRQKGPPVPA